METASGRSYQDLVVWQKAMDLVEAVYQVTRSWPSDERFGLISQIRRAVVSVPSNIAEGQPRSGPTEFLHRLSIAHGSLCEVETQLLIAERLSYAKQRVVADLMLMTTEVARLLHGLMRSLRR